MGMVGQRLVTALGILLCGTALGGDYPLKVGVNGRCLVDRNNIPFLIVGDSPHSLVVNVSEGDAALYLADRGTNGFNSLWVEVLCVGYTGGRADGSMLDGTLPFTNTLAGGSYDLTTPNEAYFAHLDRILSLAATNGLQLMLGPLDTGGWMQTALENGTSRCRSYGQYLGSRYRNFPNILWLNANDFQSWSTETNDAVIMAVALGIRDQDTNHLQTVQLNYPVSASLDDSNWAPIIGLDAVYTYYATYAPVLREYSRPNFLPVFLVEGHYEFESLWSDLGTPMVLRRQAYWSLLSGATGHLYGNGYTWPFLSEWQSQLDSVGVTELQYATRLFKSRTWYDLIPDTNHVVLASGYGTYNPSELVSESDYATAARTLEGHTVMVYVPTQRALIVDMSQISGAAAKAWWFNPQRGDATNFGTFPTSGSQTFTPPDANDWVLVLDDASVWLAPPGAGGWPLRVDTSALPGATAGVPYAVQLQASGGIGPYEWSLSPASEPLAPTLSFSVGGLLSGTPAAEGINNLVVEVVDTVSASATQSLSLVISAPDPIAPTAPLGITAIPVSSSQVNVRWDASTDNVGVTGYILERSEGPGDFAPLGSVPGIGYADTGLTAGTVYNYRVRATDAARNLSDFSAIASATTPASIPGLVAAYAFNEGTGTSVDDASGKGNAGTISRAAWTTAGKYGGALVFNGSSSLVTVNNSTSLQLTTGLTLEAWVKPSNVSSAWRDVVYKGDDNYYLEATSPISGRPGMGGTFSANPLYGTAALAVNVWAHLAATYDGETMRLYVNGVQVASRAERGNIGTSANPLQIGGDSFYGQYFQGTIDEVRIYSAALTAAQIQADMNSPIATDTQPPGAPASLTATAVSGSQINLSWTASTDNVGVTGYWVERQNPGNTNFAQVGTATGTSYNDTGLVSASSYCYRVRATDASGNLSPYSGVASATTPDTQPPTTPGNLAAMAISGSQISLSWAASTDNVGVTGYFVERQNPESTNFVPVGSATGTSCNDTGLVSASSYCYRVRATDASGNLSPYSGVASATTPDTLLPTVPGNLAATAVSGSQINLSWAASTDNVGVTGYLVERQNPGSTNFAQVGTATGTSYNDAGLTAGTDYSYRVRATDAAGNLSLYSPVVNATTLASDAQSPTAPASLTATAVNGSEINLS